MSIVSRRRRLLIGDAKPASIFDQYSSLYKQGFFIPANEHIGCFFGHAFLRYGSTLTGLSLFANPGVLTLADAAAGRNGCVYISTPVDSGGRELFGHRMQQSFITDMVATVGTVGLRTMMGFETSNEAIRVDMRGTGKAYIKAISEDTVTTVNSSDSTATPGGVEAHYCLVHDAVNRVLYLYIDGVLECTADISTVDLGNGLMAWAFGGSCMNTGKATPSIQMRRLGFFHFSNALPSFWTSIVAALYAASSGNDPITDF